VTSIHPQTGHNDDALRGALLDSNRVYQGGYLSVDRLRYEGAPSPVVREVVRVRSGVCVLGIGRDGMVSLVRQFRQAIDRVILELPAGVRDPGESALDAARRELSEEAGLVGGEWTHLRHYAHAEGYSDGWMDLFLAVDCEQGATHPDPGEELELVKVPVGEFYAMLDRGGFVDAKTILAAIQSRQILTQRWCA
jgi:ADP-ribose pyrophosphatase